MLRARPRRTPDPSGFCILTEQFPPSSIHRVGIFVTAPHRALTMLVHGPSKAGKSLLAASLPKPLLYLDVESASRFLPLRAIVWNPYDPPPEPNADWDTCVVHIRTWQDALQVLTWLQAGVHPFRGISVDSVSELQYRNLEHVASRNQMRIQDWGTVLREMGGFVRDLRDLTMHPTNPISALFITAMTQEGNDGIWRPYLQGQMKVQIPYLMDVTAYLWADDQDVRRLLTRRRMNKEAGERVNGRIPEVLVLPNVAGETKDEISAKNRTFQMIMKRVFSDGAVMPKQEAPPPPPPAEEPAPADGGMSTAAAALAAEQARAQEKVN